MGGTQPRGRLGALVVTAAAALVLGSASTALASTSGAAAQSAARPPHLIPDASWHGRAIKRPDPSRIHVQQPAGAIVIRQGAGYRPAGGSAKVREVQRRLVALGYRPGSIDGAFGPRTRSSVAWFQIKHRLAPTGAVDSQTLNLLRYRTHGWPRVAAPTAAPAAAPAKTPALTPDAAPSAPTPTPDAAPPARTGAPRPDAAPAPAPRAKHQPARAPRPDAAPAAAVAPAAHHGGSRNFIVWILAVLALQLVILALIRNWPLIRPHLPDRERLVACRTRLSERMARLRGRLQRPRDHFSGLVKRIPSPVELRERISPLARIRVPKPDLA